MKPGNVVLFGMMLASLSPAQAGTGEAEINANHALPQMQIHTPSGDVADSENSLLLLDDKKNENE